jgi:hypothetical protein
MLDIVFEPTEEPVNEEVLGQVCATTLHLGHPTFISIDVLIDRADLFEVL